MKTLKEVEDFFGKEFTARELADIIEDLDFYTDEIKSLSMLENEANADMTFVLGTLAGNVIAERIEEGRGVKVTDDQMDEIVKLGIEVAQNKYPSLEFLEPGIDKLLQGEINKTQKNMESIPDLKTHSRLKEDDVKNLEVISDEDFSDIVDSMLLNDYRHIPNVIRLPNIRGDLAEKLGLEKDAAFIMKNGISHIRPNRKGKYGQALSDEEYRIIPVVLREATFAVIDKQESNFQIVFDDIEGNLKKINKLVFNKDKLGNYLVTVGKVDKRDSFSEERNMVVGVGVAPTISALRRELPATRLRPSPTTVRSIAQEANPVNEKNATATAASFVLEKLKAAEIEVVADKGAMREILESGKRVQKMAAFHGTAEAENSFSGYGTYVVSVNEGDAKRMGMKVAQKKVGDAFYVQNQPLSEFLGGHGFSPYWPELLKQQHFSDANELHSAMMLSDTKGNEELDRQKGELSTLFKYGLVEYKKEKTFVYSIDIPDDNGNNYLLYEKPIGLEHARRINDALEKTGTQWRVTRNDGARQIYFNTLSEKVFGGNQEEASRFLKEAGFAGMKMNDANYIVFDEKDISVNKRVQYMMDKNGEVYGFAHKGKIYLDPDLLTANAPAHEYTHLWDAYAQRTNPDLWEKGKAVFVQTRLWEEVRNDPNYADIADDEDLVLSEVHSRICGELAQKVLERMAEQDGEIAKDRAIDWDNEVAEYIASELGAEFPKPELGSEDYVSDSVRQEIAREFLSRPMKDLMEGKRISRENEMSELYRENEAELKFIVEEMLEESLPGLQKMTKPTENEKDPAASTSTQLSGATSAQGLSDVQVTATATSTHIQHQNNIVEIKSQEHFIGRFNAFASGIANSDTPMPPNEFLDKIKKTFDMNVAAETTGYVFTRENNETFKIRISDHKAVLRNKVGARTELTSLVIQLNDSRRRDSDKAKLSEFVYFPESLDKETQLGIIGGINDWISGHEYTDKHYDQMYVSTARALQERLKESEQTIQKMAASIGNEKDPINTAAQTPFLNADPVQVQELYEQAVAIEKMQQEAAENVEFDKNGNPYYPKNEAAEVNARPVSEEAQEQRKDEIVNEHDVPDHDPNDGLPPDFVPPEEKADYTDENGEPRWLSDDEANGFGETVEPEKAVDFLVPESVAKVFRENPAVKAAYGHDMDEHSAEAYAEEICSILKEFSKVDSGEWNLSDDEKIAVAGISKEITEIGRIPREESVAEIRTYFMSEPYRNGKEDLGEVFSKIISTKDGNGYGFDFKMNANQKFNAELEKFISGELPSDHVFSLGTPNALLEKCGFPGGQNIELSSSHLKGKMERHNFEAKDVKNLVSALNDPVAVFAYGDEKKAENAIVELQKDGKNFLVGVHFNQERNGIFVSDIRGVFDKETAGWLNWIDQGKMIYGNKEKIQAVVDQQRTNLAEVEYLDLDSVNSILESFGNVKQIFTKDSKVYGMLGTEVPEFAMITQGGLKAYAGMKVRGHDAESNSWTLSNEGGERVVLKDKALKELTSKESEERAKKFTENTSAIEKVLETQYDDFFRQRENTANNFRHNLSVYCRKEANSPLDALRVANALVKDMSAEERRRTKGLLKSLRKDSETVNEVIVDTYFNAIKETPLNEEHLKAGRYAKIIARPMYDMISARGAKIDGSFDLKIGDTVSDIAFKTDKTFGIGKDKIFQKCEIISASKENNMMTLMDGNKSFYDVPRDTFLKEYARREKYEKKQERKEAHKKHIMRLDIER